MARILTFNCTGEGVAVRIRTTEAPANVIAAGTARNIDEMKALAERIKLTDDDTVLFSSSMDFPEEETSDKDILSLVKKLCG